MFQSMGSQRVGHDLATEQQQAISLSHWDSLQGSSFGKLICESRRMCEDKQ